MQLMNDEAIDIIRNNETFLLTAHINPEGDSLGSLFACENLLKALGKKTIVVCQDEIPKRFVFFNREWIVHSDLKDDLVYDWTIILDTPTLARIGSVRDVISDLEKTIVIDHHVSNSNFGKYNIVEPYASSCGEMIYDLFCQMGVPIDLESAQFLYTAISTDTGSFRYNNTSQKTHMIIADLIKAGVDVGNLNERLYSQVPEEKLSLLAIFLRNVKYACDKKVVWSTLTGDEIRSVNAKKEDVDGFVNFLRDIDIINIAFVAVQLDADAPVTISLRSKGCFDVNGIANVFRGGGHSKAAGCTIEGALDDVAQQIITEIEKQF